MSDADGPRSPAGCVVVTGAGSGIGAACAEHAARRGRTVVAVGRRAEALDELAARTAGRVAEPAEVAATCLHLALDATAITGIDVPVDVGYTTS